MRRRDDYSKNAASPQSPIHPGKRQHGACYDFPESAPALLPATDPTRRARSLLICHFDPRQAGSLVDEIQSQGNSQPGRLSTMRLKWFGLAHHLVRFSCVSVGQVSAGRWRDALLRCCFFVDWLIGGRSRTAAGPGSCSADRHAVRSIIRSVDIPFNRYMPQRTSM